LDKKEYHKNGKSEQDVTLENFFNGDSEIVKYARICYGRDDAINKEGLIKTLITNGHTSVFEHSVFTFKIRCPIFVARQWMRHRIGSYTEKSLRYTKPNESIHLSVDNEEAEDLIDTISKTIMHTYETLLSMGIKKEQARTILPLGTETEFYWTVNARSLMNFLKLRLDKHAQKEIREYAEKLMEIFKEKMPITSKYFSEYILEGVT